MPATNRSARIVRRTPDQSSTSTKRTRASWADAASGGAHGTELRFTGESDLVEAIRESAQQSGARAGGQLAVRNLDIQPTIRVRPGWPLRVVVHKDIVLRPWRMAER